jgi:hypothetical protein
VIEWIKTGKIVAYDANADLLPALKGASVPFRAGRFPPSIRGYICLGGQLGGQSSPVKPEDHHNL